MENLMVDNGEKTCEKNGEWWKMWWFDNGENNGESNGY